MRVTTTMKNYIHECMEKKVADRLDAAGKAAKEQTEKDNKAVAEVKKYAESLLPAMTEKVVKFAEKQGLTWLPHPVGWCGVIDDEDNHAFTVGVGSDDFEETNDRDANINSPKRKMRLELEDGPKRIRNALDRAVNAVVFSLELGKVKKAELEELIATTEIEL